MYIFQMYVYINNNICCLLLSCIASACLLQSKEGWSALTLAVQRGDDGILQEVMHTAGRLFDEVRHHL
jgi:hypothetical protein